jgi:glycosyltransferase involved in cell wall biosynthesis
MRILHIVTLLSPDSAYGGPVRVALNQCASLNSRGHHTVVAAAARGYPSLPTSLHDVEVQGFPARTTLPKIGFAGLRGGGMTRWLRDHLQDFDIAHVHLARDFVTLPAARILGALGKPFVVQTHGMVDPSDRLLARPLDLLWTRPALAAADTVFYLTPRESEELKTVAGKPLSLRELNNGVPSPAVYPSRPATGRPEVLYLARLHPRKRPAMFVQMAQQLLSEGLDADFAVAGPDEGAKVEVDTLLAHAPDPRITCEGPVTSEAVTARMSAATIYVLPSVDEPYPMSVLEAMAVGLPVVVTDTCGLAPLITETRSGLVAGADLDSLTAAVRRLLTTPKLLEEMSNNARRAAVERLGMGSVADTLEDCYHSAIAASFQRCAESTRTTRRAAGLRLR